LSKVIAQHKLGVDTVSIAILRASSNAILQT
jgi:hypothetical protein